MTGWDRSPGPDNDYASAQPSSVWRGIFVMVLVLFAGGLSSAGFHRACGRAFRLAVYKCYVLWPPIMERESKV